MDLPSLPWSCYSGDDLSISAILEAIRQSGNSQVSEIEEDAESQIREILHSARAEGEKVEEETRGSAAAPAYSQRAEIIHHARLKALQTIGNTRETLVDSALEHIRGRLAQIRSDASYPEVLGRLTEEAISELLLSLEDASDYWLEADLRDQALLEDILSDRVPELRISYILKTWGGIISKSRDSRVVVINTLEARMERASPFLRQYLAAFFENVPNQVEEKWLA